MGKLRPILITLFLLLTSATALQAAEAPAVRALLFYSPACPHCHIVLDEVLPPLQATYGDQLHVLTLDTQTREGSYLYGAAVEHFAIPQDRLGVPTLIVGDMILVGSLEIGQQFPAIVEGGLAAGGIDWPDFPTLFLVLPDAVREAAPAASAAEPAVAESALAEAAPVEAAPAAAAEATAADAAAVPPPDPVGMFVAAMVLLALLIAAGFALWRARQGLPQNGSIVTSVLVPLLAITGLGVAGYLAYVETQQVAAVCGPIGECNIVQSSSYARVFGIPIAVLGVFSYVAILGLWLWQRLGSNAGTARLSLLAVVFAGVLFSIYLTLVEIFIIRAVCAWCLTSAIVMALLLFELAGQRAQPKTERLGT